MSLIPKLQLAPSTIADIEAAAQADLTLGAKRGNAMDISSLLIALLRASKVPARYVHGTIDVESERLKNWMEYRGQVTITTKKYRGQVTITNK